jgi:hypothetical protein
MCQYTNTVKPEQYCKYTPPADVAGLTAEIAALTNATYCKAGWFRPEAMGVIAEFGNKSLC